MFFTCCSPRSSKVSGSLSRTWSRTAREMHSPPGSPKPSHRAATLTPAPKMSLASLMMSPTLMPIRKVSRFSSATLALCNLNAPLKRDGASHGLNCTREFDKQSGPGGLDDAAPVGTDLWVDQLSAACLQRA